MYTRDAGGMERVREESRERDIPIKAENRRVDARSIARSSVCAARRRVVS